MPNSSLRLAGVDDTRRVLPDLGKNAPCLRHPSVRGRQRKSARSGKKTSEAVDWMDITRDNFKMLKE